MQARALFQKVRKRLALATVPKSLFDLEIPAKAELQMPVQILDWFSDQQICGFAFDFACGSGFGANNPGPGLKHQTAYHSTTPPAMDPRVRPLTTSADTKQCDTVVSPAGPN